MTRNLEHIENELKEIQARGYEPSCPNCSNKLDYFDASQGGVVNGYGPYCKSCYPRLQRMIGR